MTTLAERAVRTATRTARAIHARLNGFHAIKPDYYLRWPLRSDDVVCDCGLGNDADFSLDVMSRFGSLVHGFDPTRKHRAGLEVVVGNSGGRFCFHPVAIGPQNGTIRFYESKSEISGSLYGNHPNVAAGAGETYDVEVITIGQVFERCALNRVAVFKIDIEGAEYEVLSTIDKSTVDRIDQLIVEFHHDLLSPYAKVDTQKIIDRLRGLELVPMSADGRNYLFYRHRS